MEELDPHVFGAGQPCFGCSPEHPIGFHLRFAKDDAAIVTRFVPGDTYQGPPGIMHGGLVMTLGDEIGAWAIIGLLGKFGFTASFSGKLKKPVRIGEELVGRGTIVRDSARVVVVAVEVKQGDVLCFEGEYTFVVVDEAGAEKLLGRPLPDVWKRFAR
jgi:acyl-coenzyme A thioesterase PaaI-like protein